MSPEKECAKVLSVSENYVERVKNEFPELVYHWFFGMSHKELASWYDFASYFNVSDNVAISIVRGALCGIGGISGLSDKLVGKGVYDSISNKRRDMGSVSVKGVLARGRVPISSEESELAYLLRETENCKSRDIAVILNEEYHEGEVVRRKKSVDNMISRHRVSLSD